MVMRHAFKQMQCTLRRVHLSHTWRRRTKEYCTCPGRTVALATTRTPGIMYKVHQQFPLLYWQVVPVDTHQGLAMRRRGEPHVYDTSAQAHKVAQELNDRRATANTNTVILK